MIKTKRVVKLPHPKKMIKSKLKKAAKMSLRRKLNRPLNKSSIKKL